MKKFFFLLIAVLALSISAFASDDYFSSSLTITYGSSTDYFTGGEGVFCFVREYPTYNIVMAISDTRNSPFTFQRSGFDAVNGLVQTSYVGTSGTVYVANCWDYSKSNITYSPNLTIIPESYTDADVADLFLAFVSGGGDSGVASSFNVPAGNVLYFKVASEQDVNFVANMPVLSNLIGSPWSSGVQYGAAAALPTSSTVFPIASQDPVNFTKSNTDTNILGQTKIGLATKHCIVGQYYALYCPFHYGDFIAYGTGSSHYDSANAGIVGANVTVSGDLIDIRVYPLSQRISQNVLGSVDLVSGSDDGFSSYYDGTVNADGSVTWTDQNGDIAAPTVGGQNYVPEEVSTQSIVGQIKDVLNNIVSEIKNLFSFGYEAIQSLVGLFSDFVSVLQQFYTWLPSPVYSALVSAIVISITIGVFKVFL